MSKAIILSRVSTNGQDLTQQTDEVLKEVYSDGYKNSDIIIIEDKESAIKLSEEERKGLNKMKDAIKSDCSIKCVYIYELSRLSRRQLVLYSIRDFLVERKIQLICLKPYFKLLESDGTMSQTGSLMFSIFSSMSESEMVLKKERMMRGRNRNLLMGKSAGGRPPFGYTTDKDKRYIVHSEQSVILRRIFNDYAYGKKSIRRICKDLKEEGLFPNSRYLTLVTEVNKWLKEEYYTGCSKFPQIVSKKVFDDAQKSLKDNKLVRCHNTKEKFLLKGLIRDGKTRLLLSGNSATDTYYSKRYSGVCVGLFNIDPLVWDFSKSMYDKYLMNKNILKKEISKELNIISKKIETIKKEIESLNSKIDKVEERMIFGKLSQTRGEELLFELSETISDKNRRYTELMNLSIAKSLQMDELLYSDMFDEESMTMEDKISIVRKVVENVFVYRLSRCLLEVKIYNKINDRVYIYNVESWKHKWVFVKGIRRSEDVDVSVKIPTNSTKPTNNY